MIFYDKFGIPIMHCSTNTGVDVGSQMIRCAQLNCFISAKHNYTSAPESALVTIILRPHGQHLNFGQINICENDFTKN